MSLRERQHFIVVGIRRWASTPPPAESAGWTGGIAAATGDRAETELARVEHTHREPVFALDADRVDGWLVRNVEDQVLHDALNLVLADRTTRNLEIDLDDLLH